MDIAIIPAYNPNMNLVELVTDLHQRKIGEIIVVNDGSDENTKEIFNQVRNYATVLTHNVNLGKGAAIKTALKYISNLEDILGIVIMDADGQHLPEDAIRLLDRLKDNYSGLVLGVRNFDNKIPIRSLFGNTVTKYVFRLCSGKWISDTQTGLRAFSADIISLLLNVNGDRYEYEMNALLACVKNKISLTEIPITTIYHDTSNSCSHFRPISDSARIYGNLLAFSGSSLLSFLLDYILFSPFVWLFGYLLSDTAALISGNIAARMISASFNYYLNSTYVFHHKENRLKSLTKYAILACVILILNTAILYYLSNLLGFNKQLAKFITEMLLFTLSYTVQKLLIFKKTILN